MGNRYIEDDFPNRIAGRVELPQEYEIVKERTMNIANGELIDLLRFRIGTSDFLLYADDASVEYNDIGEILPKLQMC